MDLALPAPKPAAARWLRSRSTPMPSAMRSQRPAARQAAISSRQLPVTATMAMPGCSKSDAGTTDPQTGTFTSRDTYLDQKPYLYCEHDPVNAVDPSGHDGFWEWWGNSWLTLIGGGKLIDIWQFKENARSAAAIRQMIDNPPPLPPGKEEPVGGRDPINVINKFRNIDQQGGAVSAEPVIKGAIKTIYLKPLKWFRFWKADR